MVTCQSEYTELQSLVLLPSQVAHILVNPLFSHSLGNSAGETGPFSLLPSCPNMFHPWKKLGQILTNFRGPLQGMIEIEAKVLMSFHLGENGESF